MGNRDKSFKTFLIIGAGTLGLVSAFALGDLTEKQISLKRYEDFRNFAVESTMKDKHGVLTPEEKMRVFENADKAYSEVVNKTILKEGFQRLKSPNLSLKDKKDIALIVKKEIQKTSNKKS
jgi:thioredoxin reductase